MANRSQFVTKYNYIIIFVLRTHIYMRDIVAHSLYVLLLLLCLFHSCRRIMPKKLRNGIVISKNAPKAFDYFEETPSHRRRRVLQHNWVAFMQIQA